MVPCCADSLLNTNGFTCQLQAFGVEALSHQRVGRRNNTWPSLPSFAGT